MPDTFISYSRRNLEFVEKLTEALAAHGKDVWFDQLKEPLQGIPPSSKWWDEIKYGIEAAGNFLFVGSPESIASPYCNAEIAHALQHEKRIVPIMYCGEIGEADTWKAINAAIDNIPEDSELPSSVSADVANLRSLTRRNWLKITEIQLVPFSADGDFERALELLIRGLDLDLAWERTWSQFKQTVQLWVESDFDDSFLWTEGRLKPVRKEAEKRGLELSESEREFLKPEQERLLKELDDIDLPHVNRLAIGERLAVMGDTRPGVGVKDGLPDIEWCYVEGTQPGVDIKVEGQRFPVQPFYIARYLVTYQQFQAFLDDSEGFENDKWWEGLTDQYRRQEMSAATNQNTNAPRDKVSWYQCVAFTRWLNAKLPRDGWPDGAGGDWQIRLPVEWEWQWAAQGGDPQNEYPWGEWDGRRANTREAGIQSRSTAVGLYPAGAAGCGALDMSGSLWEWCLNEYGDVSNINYGSNARRVFRGSNFGDSEIHARCAARSGNNPVRRSYYHGFRLVCAASPK